MNTHAKHALEPTKLATYIRHKGTDGRRFFTDAFKRAVVADIESGRAEQSELIRKFKLNKSTIKKWRKQIGDNADLRRSLKARTTALAEAVERTIAVPKPAGRTMLERARALTGETADPGDRWMPNAEHVELAIAYCLGTVSRNAVNTVLGRWKGSARLMTTTWLGSVLRWALTNGWELTPTEKP